MPIRTKRLLCVHCAVPLSRDETGHYGYACHACAVREHELTLAYRQDPDHPDAGALLNGPVDLGLDEPLQARPARRAARA